MPLDPESLRVIALIREIGRPPLHTLSPEAAREAYTGSRTVLQPEPPEVAEVEDLTCPGPDGPVRLRRYRGAGTEKEAALPCLLFMHGGGWVIGDLESHDQVCRALANYARCCVVSVDYRLAPEHKFPAAVDDSAAALRFVPRERMEDEGYGAYIDQVEEVGRCLQEGLIQSPHMPLADTSGVLETLDRARADLGVVYPGE